MILDLPFARNFPVHCFTFMGRTAQQIAIRSEQEKREIRTVWLPDYCCDTMIYPFHDCGLHTIRFYPIEWDWEKQQISIDFRFFTPVKGDVVLWCDFFIFQPELYEEMCSRLSQATLIHDVTHSLFDSNLSTEHDDYVVCSIRKWFSLMEGGIVWSRDPLCKDIKQNVGKYYLLKKQARKAKEKFHQSGEECDLRCYRAYSAQADQFAREEYANCAMSQETADILKQINLAEIKTQRYEASKDIQRLIGLDQVIKPYLFSIPLFLPENNRDQVLDFLRQSKVRCADFWEITKYHNTVNSLMLKNICIDPSVHNLEILNNLNQETGLHRVFEGKISI